MSPPCYRLFFSLYVLRCVTKSDDGGRHHPDGLRLLYSEMTIRLFDVPDTTVRSLSSLNFLNPSVNSIADIF
jgi:hypothetical protein